MIVSLPDYLRLIFHLPVHTDAEKRAAERIEDELSRRYGGLTASLLRTPVFLGRWLAEGEFEQEVWEDDEIALVMADIPGRPIHSPDFLSELQELKEIALETYAERGVPQKALWLVVQPMFLVSD